MFFVIFELAFVLLNAVCIVAGAFAISFAIFKIANVLAAVYIVCGALAMWFAILQLAFVIFVAVCIVKSALAI